VIETLEILEGALPPPALNLVQDWGIIHKEKLLLNWQRCRNKVAPASIEPLP
jgi:hypothetical protein